MIVIGERINTSRKGISPAVETRNTVFIQNEATTQAAAGISYLDINVGTFVNNEPEVSVWAIRTARAVTKVPLCIDSPSAKVLEQGIKLCRELDGPAADILLNSLSAEKKRLAEVLPIVKEHRCGIVALCLDDNGLPQTFDQRMGIADFLVNQITAAGVPLDRIFIDPLIIPLGTDHYQGKIVLDTITALKAKYPAVHIVCGLSNISYGLPERKLINQLFLVLAVQAGLDAVILDPLDKKMMSNLCIAEMILGKDEYCANYLTVFRQGQLG